MANSPAVGPTGLLFTNPTFVLAENGEPKPLPILALTCDERWVASGDCMASTVGTWLGSPEDVSSADFSKADKGAMPDAMADAMERSGNE